jgi:hypothetical protein
MATIQPVKINLPDHGPYGRVLVREWPGLTTGDKGAPVSFVNLADRSVVGLGTFAGATLRWEGFVGDPENQSEIGNDAFWLKLTDPSDNFLDMTEPKIEAITQICVLVRPVVVGGTSPSITARILVKE